MRELLRPKTDIHHHLSRCVVSQSATLFFWIYRMPSKLLMQCLVKHHICQGHKPVASSRRYPST